MEPSLLAHVQSAFPGLKAKFCLSDQFTVDLAYDLAVDALLSIEECEIVSLSDDLDQEVELNDLFKKTKEHLPWKDAKMTPRVVELLLRSYRR